MSQDKVVPPQERAFRGLQEAGYPLIERQKRHVGTPGPLISDLIAWGGGMDGEFRPQVSVEVKSAGAADPGGLSMALAQLSASAASMGTAVNLVYNDGEWLQADAGFLSLTPIEGPPECTGAEGVVRDWSVMRQLLDARLWRIADQMRGQSTAVASEALLGVLDVFERDSSGMVRGLAPGVLAPPDLLVRTWLAAASSARDFLAESITSIDVSYALASVAEVRPGDRVFDPFAGFGGTLLSVRGIVDGDVSLRGNDINPSAFRVASRLTSLLALDASFERVDSFSTVWPQSDVIVSTPPFGLRLNQPVTLEFGRVRDGDAASIALAAKALSPGGRAVLLTTRGWTFRSGTSAEMRSWLADNYRVSGLVGLPPVSSLTGLPLLLVVIDALPPAQTVVADLADDWKEQITPGSELASLLARPQ